MKQLSLTPFVKSKRQDGSEEDDVFAKRACPEKSCGTPYRVALRTEFQIAECYTALPRCTLLSRPSAQFAKKTRIVLSEPHTLGSSSPSIAHRSVLTDVQFDIKSEFAVTIGQSKLQLFSLNNWTSGGRGSSVESILELDATIVRERFQNNNLSFGFSSAQFLGGSLNLLCGFSRQHKVEVFDLEMVDENMCTPTMSFDLSAAVKNNTLSSEKPSATCVAAVSEKIGIAALSNGCLANVDTRQSSLSFFSKRRQAPFVLGENNSNKNDCVALTALSLYNDQYILTGAKNGCVCVWDRRNTKDVVSTSAMKSTVGSIIPFASPYVNGSPLVWVNDFSGELAAMRLGAQGLTKVANVQTGDGKRRATYQTIPTPKLSVLEPEGTLLLPHVSTSSLHYYDARSLETQTLSAEEEPGATVKLLQAHQFEENEVCAAFFNSTYRLLFVGDAHGRFVYYYLDF